MRCAIASIVLVSLALAGSPAMAADEWKELYLDARDKDLKNRR